MWRCPYHRKWEHMVERAYSEVFHRDNPCYMGCSVCEEWLTFSNFKKWVDKQPERDWMNKQLDKDFLIAGNRVYSPETCVFIGGETNRFIVGCDVQKGEYAIGVDKKKGLKLRPFRSKCRDPFKRYNREVGYYSTEVEAHLAWKSRKHQYALELAEIEPDPRVKEILRTRFK